MTKKTFRRLSYPRLKIVGDALIADKTVGNGRMIPALIVDTALHPEIERLVKIHQDTPPGDVRTQWATRFSTRQKMPSEIILELDFLKPIEIKFGVAFQMPDQAILVDQALTSRGFYLQPGRVGDRLSKTRENPRILAEIPCEGFQEAWDKMFPAITAAQLRQLGASRAESKRLSHQVVRELREFGSVRLWKK
ncbi:hypothetical protein FHX82_001836 [Amycolatopsis bartoniae]|uniref:Uncharacterized protein n=1 Tax=Amycolatopsis bartoniae TaxID=941986 RepID=A0A8H9IUG5_9PSEU|nr:hypothetical protein [Amycolatopsis bartoniae]MBB2934816.1 hypothetical protein [Amycolatopsis bartoniae]TVT03060.1 hypothetical protein FNH07_26080 [Amycolatopsis bartoniae]GHF44567.1 hypothetical protein GCM10017566_16900 [Amycolatopsis bartoniae]